MSDKQNFIGLGISLLILVGFAIIIGVLMMHRPGTPTQWAAKLNITICGEQQNIPVQDWTPIPEMKKAFVKVIDNNVILAQGVLDKDEKITLGKFLDVMNITLTEDSIYNYKTGDECLNGTGKLKLYINDQPREELRDYVPYMTQDVKQQEIKITFEP